MNLVLYYISQKYTDFHNILLLDEIMSFNENEQLDIADWSNLDTFRTNIDFLIALNPQACSLSFGMCSMSKKNFSTDVTVTRGTLWPA